jgi:hypothetical protein
VSREERTQQLFAEVEGLVAACRGAVVCSHREPTPDDPASHAQLRPQDGDPSEWVELTVDPGLPSRGPARIDLRFCGWTESYPLDGDPEEDDEACEFALDFVAAAIFGELRVVELRLRSEVLRRSLEVRVDGTWRRYSRAGKLGLAGARAWLRRDLERSIRSNEGRVERPGPLRNAGPRGLAAAPWAGAAVSSDRSAKELAVDGELDLHNFSPKEVAPLVREYIEVCHQRGIRDLRIVHGKGKGVLRRTVHSLLAEHGLVESYRLGGHREGSWGATIVRLRG